MLGIILGEHITGTHVDESRRQGQPSQISLHIPSDTYINKGAERK